MPKGPVSDAEQTVFLDLLRCVRNEAKLTQAALGAKAGYSQPYVAQVEGGKIRLDVLRLRRWLAACDITLERFARRLEHHLAP